MFKKLKEKITEEVKSSPSRIQQFAQAAQAAVTSASSNTSESGSGKDNFFSITEEDTPQNSPHHNFAGQNTSTVSSLYNGAIPSVRSRKLSNSSMASDISFRLPAYDSPAVYHLQSDLDASASEMEDGGGGHTTSNFEIFSKEQLHQAYRKALDRYHKYRGRYTELARRYRELERDSNKARSVLVETQDKALRRISELREQCTLEQQAKAHLEAALRLEMDEMQCIIKTLKTKSELLSDDDHSNSSLQGNNLIHFDSDSTSRLATETNGNDNSDDNANDIRIKELEDLLNQYKQNINEEKSKLIIKDDKIDQLNRRLDESQKQIVELRSREEENNILLAENKLMVHSELNNRESEISTLKQRIKELEHQVKSFATEKENFSTTISNYKQQETKSNEKIKQLEVQLSALEKTNISLNNAKQEVEAKIIIAESEKQSMKKFKQEYGDLLRKNEALELISQQKSKEIAEKLETELKHVKAAHAELSEQLNQSQINSKKLEMELDVERASFRDVQDKLMSENKTLTNDTNTLGDRIKTLLNDKQKLSTEIEQLKVELESMTIERQQLHQQVHNLTEEMKNVKIINENSESDAIKSLQESMKLNIRQLEDQLHLKLDENRSLQSQLTEVVKEKDDSLADIVALKSKIDSLKSEKRDLEKTLEKEIREKAELQIQVTNILQEIGRLEEQLKEVKRKYTDIEKEKLALEERTKNQSQQLQTNMNELEMKLSESQRENSQLTESNSHLEQTVSQLQAIVDKTERKCSELETSIEIGNDTQKDSMELLEEKLRQCLDENSKLLNAKELLDHEFRSLQDQHEAREKEKLCLMDTNKCLDDQLKQYVTTEESNVRLQQEKERLERICDQLRLEVESNRSECVLITTTCQELTNQAISLRSEIETLSEKLAQNEESLGQLEVKVESLEIENKSLRDQTDQDKESFVELNRSLKKLNEERDLLTESLKESVELKKMSENYEQSKIENEYLNTMVKQLENAIDLAAVDKLKLTEEISELNGKIKSLQCELYVTAEQGAKHTEILSVKNTEIDQLKNVCVMSQTLSDSLQTELRQQRDQYDAIKLLADELQVAKDSAERKIQQLEQICVSAQNELKQIQSDHAAVRLLNDECKRTNESLNEDLTVCRTELITATKTNKQLEKKLDETRKEIESSRSIIADLHKDLESHTQESEVVTGYKNEIESLNDRIKELQIQLDENTVRLSSVHSENLLQNAQQTSQSTDELNNLRQINAELTRLLSDHQKSSDGQISNLHNEIDELIENAKVAQDRQNYMQNRLSEYEQSMSDLNSQVDGHLANDFEKLRNEHDECDTKLKKILHEVNDVSNRNLFLEQKCENYLILEQSNERLKSQNEKLSRQLDETLVSLQHSEGITANTEFEYLKNIMFQYLTNNKSGNGATLVKVIAAVLKFSPQQTQVALEKESHKNALLAPITKIL